MSTLLWKYFLEDDVDNFRQVLAGATYNASAHISRGGYKVVHGSLASSPSTTLATSPTLTAKSPKQSTSNTPKASARGTHYKATANVSLSRADVNWKDTHGVTLLHYMASSTSENAPRFAMALLQLPVLDLYSQDEESGWTALHRALYFGNIAIARALMDRDVQDAIEHSSAAPSHGAGDLIKIKDREGNSPFDVYGASTTARNIRQDPQIPLLGGNQDDEDNEHAQGVTGDMDGEARTRRSVAPTVQVEGDEVFAFGSNKNFTLGFGDEDDRQFPERIHLRRPDYLLRRFGKESQLNTQETKGQTPGSSSSPLPDQLPVVIQYRPMIIQDVQLAKLHSAVLTTDPEANLYMCGFGSGGRLGMGDETTRFSFVNVRGGGLMGRKVIHVGLGQNHTVAISADGETFSWGSNAYCQLGFAPSSQSFKDEEHVQLLPRQIFGPLKRELVVGAAASRIHSVVHTANSLYTFGKNEGQLGLVDSDARSLATQNTPRKVAASLFSSPIYSVSAIDRASVCLLENRDVWVFSNYGYTKMAFPLEGFSNYFLNSIWGSRASSADNQICKITSGGDTICALSSMGDVFTFHVTQKVEPSVTSTSTTNPSKIRGALTPPQRVWSLKKGHMAVRDVDVSQDGSIIICTKSGSVWQRVKRAKIKDASAGNLSEYRAKDYKFSRVPGLTRIAAVRSSTFGAYAAIRRDIDIMTSQMDLENKNLWKDIYPLLPFHGLAEEDSDTENPAPRFWTPSRNDDVAAIRRAVLTATDIEQDVEDILSKQARFGKATGILWFGTTTSEVRIPTHEFILGARSEPMRQALLQFRKAYFYTIPEMMTIEYESEGQTLILFQGIDFLTVFNLVLYMYTDSVADVWNHTKHTPASAFRYRSIRVELMKIASHLHMYKLEQAVRVMQEPPKTLDRDFQSAISQPGFFDNGDVEIELNGENMKVHSPLMIQRCPFFEGLFEGRSDGLWLSSRRKESDDHQEAIKVDLKHVEPHIFRFVLNYLYSDTDEDMFDDVVAPDLDSYLDIVLDVMSVANELMLDRLTQSCQKVLGRYGKVVLLRVKTHRLIEWIVTTRNVCQLLNAVAPCSVTQFKDAALEYICLNLEALLENRLLGELDEELMLELDEVVRQNQLACLPIAKSGRAEAELIERYPQLLDLIERGKQAKVDSVGLQTRMLETESRPIGGTKGRATLLEDFDTSPSGQKSRPRPSHAQINQMKSPALRSKQSTGDLMFEMEEDSDSDFEKLSSDPATQSAHSVDTDLQAYEESESLMRMSEDAPSASIPSSYNAPVETVLEKGLVAGIQRPWGTLPSPMSRIDMKDIMAQDSPTGKISTQSSKSKSEMTSSPSITVKLSQRERKLQQQRQAPLPAEIPFSQSPSPAAIAKEPQSQTSPWQVAARGPKVSLKDVLGVESSTSPQATAEKAQMPSSMTLRQTIAGKTPPARQPVTGPAQPPHPPKNRSISTPDISRPIAQSPPLPSRSTSSSQTTIHSIRHKAAAPPIESTLQLSMADILSQQQTEKEIIKEAAAKRSLQEIQEEQAFQEWWDEESRKVRAEELEAARPKDGRGGRGVRGKGASVTRVSKAKSDDRVDDGGRDGKGGSAEGTGSRRGSGSGSGRGGKKQPLQSGMRGGGRGS